MVEGNHLLILWSIKVTPTSLRSIALWVTVSLWRVVYHIHTFVTFVTQISAPLVRTGSTHWLKIPAFWVGVGACLSLSYSPCLHYLWSWSSPVLHLMMCRVDHVIWSSTGSLTNNTISSANRRLDSRVPDIEGPLCFHPHPPRPAPA